MSIVPIVDEGLGNSAYVVDLADGSALVVDPERDPRPYLAELDRLGLTPRFVVETHLHADFVSGAQELATAGARLLAPAGSGLANEHQPLSDGDEVDLGGLTLEVVATPGHTPEHLAYLLRDGSTPLGLFSGGTLIAGGTARTDLLSPELTEPLARQAYRSIHDRLLVLPDELAVLPTHGSGSFCSTAADGERTTTIGRERETSPLLADDPDEETFVTRLLSGYGTYPPYFHELREVNRAGVGVHGPDGPPLARLSAADVAMAMDEGAEVVDTRPAASFAAAHVPGALSIIWRGSFATWLGWLTSRDRALVFVVDDEVDDRDVAWAAATVGFERLVGVLDGGMDAWSADGRASETLPLVAAAQAGERRIVDVRQRSEHEADHVVGSLNVELGALAAAADRLDAVPTLVHCASHERAMSAGSLLQRAGHPDLAVLDGGPSDLAEAGHRLAGEA